MTDYERTLDWIDAAVAAGQRGYVCVANTHTVTATDEDEELRDAVPAADLAVPDGQPLVCRPRPRAQLLLTGQDHGARGPLRRRAEELGVGAHVHHLGHVTAETLAGLYRPARAMMFSSLYGGVGAPPLEAIACGSPLACSDATSLPEVSGDAALPFGPHSVESIAGALARVSGDAGLREQLRGAGLERAQSFTWHASAERHRAIYARVAAT
jgi:glycosyltransferase involved in cell wall biosynthesis